MRRLPCRTHRAAALAALSLHCRDGDVTITVRQPTGTAERGRGYSGSLDSSSDLAAVHETDPSRSLSGSNVARGTLSPREQLDDACGSGKLTPSGEARIARRPYIQDVTPTSAVVLFTTLDPVSSATLHVTQPPSSEPRDVPSELDPADSTGHQRRVALNDLQPGTTYCYQLEDWLAPVGFRTAPPLGDVGAVRFVAFGDSGGESRDLVRHGMERLPPFDLILHAGDIAYMHGTLAEFESTFFSTYAELIARTPIFPVSGNHEYWTADATPYRQVFALPENGTPDGVERWFSFDWGSVHFVGLDTERIGSEQAAWLEHDLSETELSWKIVYLHRPPFSSGQHGSAVDVREAFSPLFERFSVQLVIAGHEHDYERTTPIGGVTYVVSGGGGFGLRVVGSSDFTAYSEAIFHVVYGEISGDALWLRAIDPSGRVIDSARIPRDG